MNARYDEVGDAYRQFKTTAAIPVPERRLFHDLLGDVSGLRVLDLATGYGLYARLALAQGAAEAVGVDISAEMVRGARRATVGDEIAFHTADARDLPELGDFDVVTAVWLFNYAQSPDDLADMAAGAAGALRPGGRLVAITVHPAYDAAGPDWLRYGLAVHDVAPVPRGQRLNVSLSTPTQDIPLTVFRWDADVYAEAMTRNGLDAPTWRVPHIPAEEAARWEPNYWDAAVANPLIAGFSCVRGAAARGRA